MAKFVGQELANKVAGVFRHAGEGNGYFGEEQIKAEDGIIRLYSQAGEETVEFRENGTIHLCWDFEEDEEDSSEAKGEMDFNSFKEFLDKVQGECWGWWCDVDFSRLL